MSQPLNVLIIDDDEVDRRSIIRAMKQSPIDITIVEAATAADGIYNTNRHYFDVVLLDYLLPDKSGLEVLATMRTSENRGTAVVMISQFEDDDLAERALQGGAQDFLLKTEVNTQRLTRAVALAKQRYKIEHALHISHDKLRRLVELDPLTGLANRRTFHIALESAVHKTQLDACELAVLFIDLDNFKRINDSFGHNLGDAMLTTVAKRIQLLVGDGNLLARLGSDQFLVLVQNSESENHVQELAERIIRCFDQPIEVRSASLVMSCSIGIAFLGKCATTANDLVKCADIAMNRAKVAGRNRSHSYTEKLHQVMLQRSLLEVELSQALANNEFLLYFQPFIKATDGQLGGMEVLLRWENPRLGLILPGQFLALAVELGLMIDIDNWVIKTACQQFRSWQSNGLINQSDITMSVNISALQLQKSDFTATLTNTLAHTGLDPKYLELEITENSIIANPQYAAEVLTAISQMGIRLSLDDFGTGYSSFEHLRLFPVQTMKIDQTFISTIGTSSHHEQLLIAMIRFAQSLRLNLVAEGVERHDQVTFCQEQGCDLLQGFYYAKALPPEEFAATYLTQL